MAAGHIEIFHSGYRGLCGEQNSRWAMAGANLPNSLGLLSSCLFLAPSFSPSSFPPTQSAPFHDFLHVLLPRRFLCQHLVTFCGSLVFHL